MLHISVTVKNKYLCPLLMQYYAIRKNRKIFQKLILHRKYELTSARATRMQRRHMRYMIIARQ